MPGLTHDGHLWPNTGLPNPPAQGQAWRPRTHSTDTFYLPASEGLPAAGPPQPPRVPCCPPAPQQAETCDWPVVDSPAHAGGRAAPGRTAKPQPVPGAQAAVPRQGGEDGHRQDGEVHPAVGAAHGVLGCAGIGTSILALWAKGGVSLELPPPPAWATSQRRRAARSPSVSTGLGCTPAPSSFLWLHCILTRALTMPSRQFPFTGHLPRGELCAQN